MTKIGLIAAVCFTVSLPLAAEAKGRCTGSAKGVDVDLSDSSKVIGKATCGGEIKRELNARLCDANAGRKIFYTFRYEGKSGVGDFRCSGSSSSGSAAESAPPAAAHDSTGLKPGQYAGVQRCVGTLGATEVDVTSKKTIGVATCKGEISRELQAKGACAGRAGDKLQYGYKFGEASAGTADLRCPR